MSDIVSLGDVRRMGALTNRWLSPLLYTVACANEHVCTGQHALFATCFKSSPNFEA